MRFGEFLNNLPFQISHNFLKQIRYYSGRQKAELLAEKKRPQNWLQRQFSRKMSNNNCPSGIEEAAAVAAAAYAIQLLNESSIQEHEMISLGPAPSLARINSKKEDRTISIQEPGEVPSRIPEIAAADEKTHVRVVGPTQPTSIKKAPTMENVPTIAMNGIKPESQLRPQEELKPIKPQTSVSKPDKATTTKPAIQPTKTQGQSPRGPGTGETKADAWERAEMDKIKKRYEQVSARIQKWENKKKTKARHRLDRTESDVERKRLKAMEKFRNGMNNIDQIVGGATAKATKRQRKEEFKVKEKANTIRKTGKISRTCFCF